MNLSPIKITLLCLIPLLFGAMFAQTIIEGTALIIIKAGSLVLMEPSHLYCDTQYTITVRVFDKNDKPMSGSVVEFKAASALASIDGSPVAITDQNGVATFNLKFTGGGVIELYVDGSKAGTLFIYYRSFPTGALVFLVCVFVLAGSGLAYTLYRVYKSLRET